MGARFPLSLGLALALTTLGSLSLPAQELTAPEADSQPGEAGAQNGGARNGGAQDGEEDRDFTPGLETGLIPDPAQPSAPARGTPARLGAPVLTLNQDMLFQNSAWGRAAIERAEEATAELILENRGIEASLEEEERSLTARRTGMPPADFSKLAEEFDQKVEDFRNGQDGKSRLITQRLEADRQKFFDLAVPVLVELLSAHEAVMIIADDAVILALSSVDVTAEAIALMDQRLPPPLLPDAPPGAETDEAAQPEAEPGSDPAP